MKKVLAIFLSALLICISVAPMSMAASDPGLATRVVEGGYDETASAVNSVEETTFTMIIKAPAVKKLTGVNLYVSFDATVLAVADAGLAGWLDAEDNYTPYFSNGVSVSDFKSGSNNEYAFGWVSSDGVTKKAAKDIFYITFYVIDTTKAETAIDVFVDEFRTDDGNDANDVTATIRTESKIVSFNFPENTPPATTDGSSEGGEGSSDTTTGDINGLLQLIRDMLSGNNVTFGDWADAVANLLGNAEITDIIEMLVDGNIDVSEMFQQILDSLGLDFGMFEDLLNKIIEFFKGLFSNDESDKTTAVATTAAANLATTAAGSSSGSEETGDVGIALAATVCVAASAGFVLTRKKKETV